MAGGHYMGEKGRITLIMKDGKPVAHGTKINNHLYKMGLTLRDQHPMLTNLGLGSNQTNPKIAFLRKHRDSGTELQKPNIHVTLTRNAADQ